MDYFLGEKITFYFIKYCQSNVIEMIGECKLLKEVIEKI